jgi:hypothetical protein
MTRTPSSQAPATPRPSARRFCLGLVQCAAAAGALLAPGAALAAGASSQIICSLVGEGTHNGTNPTSNHQPNLHLYGTDLGFSFKHKNQVVMLFGDTWIEDDFICQPPPLSDDSLGRIFLSEDDDPDDCLDIRFPQRFNGDVKPIRVFDGLTELNMGALRTPITGWSDNVHPYGYFAGDIPTLCQPNQPQVCPDGLLCDPSNVWCVDPGVEPVPSPFPYPSNTASTRHIAVSRLPFNPQRFRVGYTYLTTKFFNATSRVIGQLDERNPDNDVYEPTDRPRELLMWGRPNFAWLAPNSSNVYLLHHSLAALDGPGFSVSWHPRYFAGLDNNDNPVWTNDQIFAIPVIDDETVNQVLQFTVAWVAPIQRFVMLYSGRLPQFSKDNPDFGVYLRTAEHPWGPWSKPQLIWNAKEEGAYDCPGIMYDKDAKGRGCPMSDPYRPNFYPTDTFNNCPGHTPMNNDDIGVEYGVNILDNFTKPGLQINTAVIYWNLSTWNPYRVVLLKTTLDASVIVSP